MAVEIISKPKPKKSFLQNVSFGVSVVLVLILIGSYFFLYQISKTTSKELNDKKDMLVKWPSEKTLEDALVGYETKINNFKNLLSSHQKPINIFVFFEDVCHPDVWFSDFNFNSSSKAVSVKGEAKSFIAVEQQILILKQMEFVKDLKLSGVSINKGGKVDFSLQLTFVPQLFE
ncbi:MAG: hypothetical protein PHI53_02845 [Candidatus Pacebacteria bacterium]|nr:hypothetical protein [Candidatus Paceibacterota bacterium]